ncbi:MAG: helix-turn-helix domain-containing protein [Clostridiales bacterium]|nr:helix-turn-helix domain-containing protein [Clostridiales bacterium]
MSRIIDSKKCNIVGENVKNARLMRNMSQKQLADKLETFAVYVCRGSISRIESGERTVTDIEIDGLSKVLNVSINYLFGRKES